MKAYEVFDKEDMSIAVFSHLEDAAMFAAKYHHSRVEEIEIVDEWKIKEDSPIKYMYKFGYNSEGVYFLKSFYAFDNEYDDISHDKFTITVKMESEDEEYEAREKAIAMRNKLIF